jgi:DNA-binding transcriptional LysR family regulator
MRRSWITIGVPRCSSGGPRGVRLTPAGLTMLRHARTILDAVAAAGHVLTAQAPRTETVRLGVFISAGCGA